MDAVNEGTSGVAEASATTLADFVEDAFSGRSEDSFGFASAPQSESGSDAAGDAPAEPTSGQSETPTTETDGPEGDASREGADKNAATTTAPDKEGQQAEGTETAPAVDPLANAVACDYVVNGETRKYEDLRVIPGQGAVITADALPRLQQRLSERDHLFETGKAQYKALTDLEKATEWKQAGPDGAEQVLTGLQGIEATRVTLGRTLAALQTITEALSDPEQFSRLVGVDANGRIVPDAREIQYLRTKADLAEVNAERQVRSYFQQQTAQASASGQASQVASQNQSASVTLPDTFVEQYANTLGVKGLTADDKTLLSSLAPRFVRVATREDVLANPTLTVGSPVIESTFADLVKRQGELRATTANSAVATQAALKAQSENAARLAAAKTTTKPSAQSSRAKERPRNDDGTFAKSNDARWAFMNS